MRLKSRRKKLVLIVVGIAICFGGIVFFLFRNFFYNKYNVHARRAVLETLSERYDQEFELLSTEFETKETETGGARYVHIWTYQLPDEQGRQFDAYVRCYGLVERGDGNFLASDYFNYIDDTYGQLCIEERTGS